MERNGLVRLGGWAGEQRDRISNRRERERLRRRRRRGEVERHHLVGSREWSERRHGQCVVDRQRRQPIRRWVVYEDWPDERRLRREVERRRLVGLGHGS